jgi:Spy/CpxP family protein refolding chaperone
MSWFLTIVLAAAASEPTTPAEVDARIEARLDAVDATPAQRERIGGLVEELREKKEGFREEAKALRTEFRELLLAETIDRKAVEAVRRDFVDLFDRATSTVTGQLVQLAETLSPEQRAELLAHARSK